MKSAEPTASVVVPVYNAREDLSSLLDALAAQTREPTEVLLVDDGSTDGSPDRAEEWAKDHPGYPLRVLTQENCGPAAARNRGAREARGDILVFVDSDCLPEADWLAKMIEPFTRAEDDPVVGVQGTYRCKQREVVARFSQLEIEDRYTRMSRTDGIDFIGTYAAAYRREVFIEQGCFDDRFPMASGEDADFSFRLASQGLRMVFQPEAVVYHRHPASIGKYLSQKYWRAYWRNLIYRRHRSRMLKDSYTPQTLKIQTALGMVFPLSPIAFAFPFPVALLPAAILAAILVLSLPFSLWAFKRDPFVGLVSPFIILFRALALGTGLAYGLLKGLWLNEDYL